MADSTLPLYLMAMVSTMLVLYNFIVIYCCPRPLPGVNSPAVAEENTASNVEPAAAAAVQADFVIGDLIPAHTYCKGTSDGLVGDEGACAVCLSEFEEGEALRTLPECLHSFHAACIDMWLLKHPNCPICRANQLAS